MHVEKLFGLRTYTEFKERKTKARTILATGGHRKGHNACALFFRQGGYGTQNRDFVLKNPQVTKFPHYGVPHNQIVVHAREAPEFNLIIRFDIFFFFH